MRKRTLAVLLAVLGAMFAGGPAFAQVPADGAATSTGGTDVDERVRERQRMREEYEDMRETRAEALKEARLETAGTSGEQIPGWKEAGARAGRLTRPDATGAKDSGDGSVVDTKKVAGARRYIFVVAFASLGVMLLIRFRRGRQ